MASRWVRESVVWVGLIVLGVTAGNSLVPVVKAYSGGIPIPSGDLPHFDADCVLITCFDIHVVVGGTCGNCTGGIADPDFDKCIGGTMGNTCVDNGMVNGVANCHGACTIDQLRACTSEYNKCN
ncbi:MAG: hypothetical protein K2X82_11535 [Gemmataceae bacterium]|nr:hypothetical protein [Gemmataceae bacterium]